MQLFPPEHELQFLLGKEISNVVFGTGSVHFVWWEGGEIHAMRDFDHTDPEGLCHQFGRGMSLNPPSLLHRLIQRKVLALNVDDNSLTLRFDDGQSLVFRAYTGCGENGLILLGKDISEDYIVF
jgi:hypothetical protein